MDLKRRYLKTLITYLALAALLFGLSGCPESDSAAPSKMERIVQRGHLICGLDGGVPGFGFDDGNGSMSGFDVDYCKAVAAALLGDPAAVELRAVNAQERFGLLAEGTIDLLIGNVTQSLGRDATAGVDFAPVTYFDGQSAVVRSSDGIASFDDFDGRSVCVLRESTNAANLRDWAQSRGIVVTLMEVDNTGIALQEYEAGACDGFSSDSSVLAGFRQRLTRPTDHLILGQTISKEPLAPAVRERDQRLLAVLRWVIYATFEAEELGITRENIDQKLLSADSEVRRFLGLEGSLGADLGVDADFTVRIIRAVGNHGEIYERNLGSGTVFDIPKGHNALYTEGGLVISPPFR